MNGTTNRRAALSGALSIAVLALQLAIAPPALAAQVLSPDDPRLRSSYRQLAGEWANWLQLEPVASNPAFDPDGSFCHLNQRGRVWFLAGTFGGIANRVCHIPPQRAVFFPILANVSSAPDFLGLPPCNALAAPVDQIRCDVNDDTPVAPNVRLALSVDGAAVGDLYAYRVQSPPGGFVFHSGALFEEFGVPSGPRDPGVVDGYWILLKPLHPGEPRVSFSADLDADGIPDLGADYLLKVRGGHHHDD